jgi:putative flippase GtrA
MKLFRSLLTNDLALSVDILVLLRRTNLEFVSTNTLISSHLSKINLAEIMRFGIVGLSSLGLYYAFLISFVELLGVPVLLSAILAYLVATIWNYWRQRNWAFKSGRDHKSSIPGYLLTHAIGICINTGVLYIFTYHFGLHYILSQAFAICAVAAWTYLSLKRWVFSKD